MLGIWPVCTRSAHAPRLAAALALALTACAHAPVALPAAPPHEDEAARLRAELAQRDQIIVQLENRLALAEAGQRQLRADLERAEAQPAAREPSGRESVRIGGRAREPSPEPPEPIAVSEPARPMLRLHADQRSSRAPREQPEYASTWTPPATSERLSVVPLPDLGARRAPVAARAPTGPSAPSTAVPTSAEPSEDLYVRGLDLLRRREFAEAQRELAAFITASPRDPRVGRAHFFRGELMFAERDYAHALAAYEQALASDPSGEKVPDALLRSAACQLQLGQREQARITINKLRARFPDSDAARRSALMMQEDSG